MISISYLFEGSTQYEPFMTGTAKQIGGPSYPTAQYRVGTGPPSVMIAAQKAEEAKQKALALQQIRDLRRRKNPTQEERLQGAF
jgi:hypothetical protein